MQISPALKDHLEQFGIVFVGTFLTGLGTAFTSGQLDFAHLTGSLIISVLVSCVSAAVKVAWNKTVYGTVAGKFAPAH